MDKSRARYVLFSKHIMFKIFIDMKYLLIKHLANIFVGPPHMLLNAGVPPKDFDRTKFLGSLGEFHPALETLCKDSSAQFIILKNCI